MPIFCTSYLLSGLSIEAATVLMLYVTGGSKQICYSKHMSHYAFLKPS